MFTQAPTGGVSGCWRVPARGPGSYLVALTTFRIFRPRGKPGRLGPAVTLGLKPSSGPPGTAITVTGTLASPRPGKLHGTGTLCWDGCRNGIWSFSSPNSPGFRWLSPTRFTATLTAPSAPWIGDGRAHSLMTGTYRVAATCLGPIVGTPKGSKQLEKCMYGASEGSAMFHLTVQQPVMCDSANPCSKLRFSPASARPGQLVSVTGTAPVTSTAPTLARESSYGITAARRPGTAITSQRYQSQVALPGGGTFHVLASPTWASLGHFHALRVASGAFHPVAASAGHPSTVAACSAGSLRVSHDGGSTWRNVPGPSAAMLPAGFTPGIPGGSTATPAGGWRCQAVLVDPANDSVIYAAYPAILASAGLASAGMPDMVGVFTTNAGRSWSLVPRPAGARGEGFAGFTVRGKRVLALYLPSGGWMKGASVPLVEETTSSGASWAQAPMPCPTSGPCLAFDGGSNVPQGMGAPQVPGLLASSDRGGTWAGAQAFGQPVAAGAQLIALGASQAVLVSPAYGYPAALTTDGGRSWSYLRLPPLPGAGSSAQMGAGLPAGPITALSDGELLAPASSASHGRWSLLARGASSWCALPPGLLPGPAQLFGFGQPWSVGQDLWWQNQGSGSGAGAPVLSHVSLSRLVCA